ncbi:MAG: glycine cleavage system protein GcvH [Deltaproteobacteria bacterium]|nr:glycine cleavage system protein GcvH [Deltaproteobacteria bacterium]
MKVPGDLRYTKEHEWVRVAGNVATVGITDHAQTSLGDIVFCELPSVGSQLEQFKTFGVVESVKAVSDLYAPVSGKVLEVNQACVDNPASLNSDPYGVAWLVKVELTKPAEVSTLLDPKAYENLIKD